VDLVAAGLPEIKHKLSHLHPLAAHLSLHHDLHGVETRPVESDEWSRGDRDFIKDGLSTFDPPSSPEVIYSTYGDGGPRPPASRRLGVGRQST
jgi:hypothetical protein